MHGQLSTGRPDGPFTNPTCNWYSIPAFGEERGTGRRRGGGGGRGGRWGGGLRKPVSRQIKGGVVGRRGKGCHYSKRPVSRHYLQYRLPSSSISPSFFTPPPPHIQYPLLPPYNTPSPPPYNNLLQGRTPPPPQDAGDAHCGVYCVRDAGLQGDASAYNHDQKVGGRGDFDVLIRQCYQIDKPTDWGLYYKRGLEELGRGGGGGTVCRKGGIDRNAPQQESPLKDKNLPFYSRLEAGSDHQIQKQMFL